MRGASRGRRRQGREEPERENRGGRKYGPRGPRKPLKRLDSDKEIKVNSKENPRVCQTIPRNFQGFSRKSKDFQDIRLTRGSIGWNRLPSPGLTPRVRPGDDGSGWIGIPLMRWT